MNLDQKQNWLFSVPSSPSELGLGRQFCHHAEVHSRSNLTSTTGLQLCRPRSMIGETPNVDLGQKKNWLLSVPSSPSIHGVVRQLCPNAKVDSKSKCTNRKCDNDVVCQLATLLPSPSRKCDHDVDNQLDTLLPSPCNRLPHRYSDWGGNSVIMQR